MSQTPETDAEACWPFVELVATDFARKLERERDDSRRKCHGAIKEAAEQSAELHQLRAVCDELALASIVRQESDRQCDASYDEDTANALHSYRALPHAKARK